VQDPALTAQAEPLGSLLEQHKYAQMSNMLAGRVWLFAAEPGVEGEACTVPEAGAAAEGGGRSQEVSRSEPLQASCQCQSKTRGHA
jgi:hypothetical protein